MIWHTCIRFLLFNPETRLLKPNPVSGFVGFTNLHLNTDTAVPFHHSGLIAPTLRFPPQCMKLGKPSHRGCPVCTRPVCMLPATTPTPARPTWCPWVLRIPWCPSFPVATGTCQTTMEPARVSRSRFSSPGRRWHLWRVPHLEKRLSSCDDHVA